MIPTPVSKKIRSRLNLSIQKKPHFLFRQNLLFDKREKWEPKLRKGYPEFAKQFDILNRQVNLTKQKCVHSVYISCNDGAPNWELQYLTRVVTGFRKYRPPIVKKEEIKKNYDISNFHEVKSKFRFEINGFFEDGGNVFCEELYRTARRMFIVGWIKCRSRFAMGHFQGDSYAISYLRHWFDMYSSEKNKIEKLKVFDENHGIPTFDYYSERLQNTCKEKNASHSESGFFKNKGTIQFKIKTYCSYGVPRCCSNEQRG
ncbi:acylphosphatase [Plasmodium brasilianum]|uniref:Acylphosphatase n=1 Tax=Plasmodium brasilianum TaxID=5824 RepID=A0ACB9Y8P4_PLABR|nr:acylphosphatase [Plasmodium brasilianum]